LKPKLKIIIFDGSFKTTTFINRLVAGLLQHNQVFIVGFNNKIDSKIPGVHYIDLGSTENLFNLLLQSTTLAFKKFFKTGSSRSFIEVLKSIFSLNKHKLQQTNFNTVLALINPDVVHVQWPSLLPWCEDAMENGNYKFVLSQRGYQSNVRPLVSSENFHFLQKCYPKISGIHSVSKAISKAGDSIYNSENKIEKVVYSGFDFKELLFQEHYHKSLPLKLLSVGRPHWIKGYSDAIRACSFLKAKGIEFKYTIIGAKEDNEELLYLIKDLGLQNDVSLLSKIKQKEVYKVMQEASVLLFSSIKEGLPNVVVEAMALGLPVISTACGGVAELLDVNTGWLVPIRNPEALTKAIIEFSNTSEEEIQKIRWEARKKVENLFSVEQMVSGMEALYLEVCAANNFQERPVTPYQIKAPLLNTKLKIIIFDGSFNTTTFINRLVKGLSKKHQIYIFGFNTEVNQKLPNVNYISLGSSEQKLILIWRSFSIGIRYFFKTRDLYSFLILLKNTINFDEKALIQSNYDKAIGLIHPDIIHVQWVSLLSWCEICLNNKKTKVILSQLGYQTNVRPFVNDINFKYLQRIYPKIDSFHSITKEVSDQGDKIFNSVLKIDHIINLGFKMDDLKYNKSLFTNKDSLQILSVGRSHWIKGYDSAIEACSILKQNKIDFKYTIIGVAENEEIQYLIDDFNLKEHIFLIPKMHQEDVYKEMSKASLLLLPSVKEGLPNVVVEAMAVGLPVIATRCGGVEGLINHTKNGWLVPTYNPKAIAEAITMFISLPVDEIENSRLLARKTVEELFSEEETIKNMEKLYYETIEIKNAGQTHTFLKATNSQISP